MPDSFEQLLIPLGAVALNGALLLWCGRRRLTALRAALRCAAFLLFTVAIFRAHITPTQTPDLSAAAEYRLVRGAVQIVWWLLAASTANLLARLYFAFDDRTRQERFTLDVVETLLYLTAAVAIVADVFDIPLKGVLATSGAVAIVLGLALQSTLADLFSGFVINATAPYRVGDHISLDDNTEGVVLEITWRATHVLKRNQDLIVVPNSTMAKTRVTNTSVPGGVHASIVNFQAVPTLRPSTVITALRLAVESCVDIDEAKPVDIVTKSVGWQAVDYEITFFVSVEGDSNNTKNVFFDAAYRHLEALATLTDARDALKETGDHPLARKLIDGIDVFGLLSTLEKTQLAGTMTVRELAPGDVLLHAGEVPAAITIVGYGVVSASTQRDGKIVEVMRFSPSEYFGESGPVAGVAVDADLSARTHVIVFDLPASAVAGLLRVHPGMSQALAAKLAERERRGQALMQVSHDQPMTHHGLLAWLERTMQTLHGLRV
ncbi:mechanosensitive ion channel domain-containing protein [Paraburkholderia sp. BCC1884]|uniref:mechanosensitive ion channel domain-containing protein n=1 Tax=Paraburkholderia sp. BCC1884 TaxID=2562668 RepID=UPI001182D9FC|nr:mechanosensitive ion channel family protein [Paraburkholderia sp. BCC1884]